MDWILDNPWALWTIIAVFFLVLEIFVTDFTSFVFAIGAAAAAGLAALGADWWLQIAALVSVTLLLYLLVRPKLQAFLERNVGEHAVGHERILGKTAKVVREDRVEVVVNGVDVWTARSVDGAPLIVGSTVQIDKVEGSILVVSPTTNTKVS